MGRTKRKRKKRGNSEKPVKIGHCEVFTELQKWMSCKGWKPVAKLCPAIFPGTGRGLMALKPLNPGDLIVQIPENLLITRAEVVHTIPQLYHSLSTAELLTLYLLHCRLHSLNTNYLRTLPEQFCVGALLGKEIEFLPEKEKIKIQKNKGNLLAKFEKMKAISKHLYEIELQFDTFVWAWCSVNTRAVFFKDTISSTGSKDERNMALAPYLDLLNHNAHTLVEAGFNKLSCCYEIRTLKRVKKFDQVFINYGPHDNISLLVNYGFIIPGNIHGSTEFELEMLLQLTPIENTRKMAMVKDLSRCFFCSRDGLSWHLEIALTISAMKDTQFDSIQSIYDIEPDEAVTKSWGCKLIKDKITQLESKLESLQSINTPMCPVVSELLQDWLDILYTGLRFYE